AYPAATTAAYLTPTSTTAAYPTVDGSPVTVKAFQVGGGGVVERKWVEDDSESGI
ncbi:hypothetical protein A2U01_0047000, partial [Trifolium medium]|nr:hypothetical protein [Trifolium medium]